MTTTRIVALICAVCGVVTLGAQPAIAEDPAAVHVENDGHHELESEVDWGWFAHVGSGVEVPMLQCAHDLEVEIADDGHLLIYVSDIFSHAGSTGSCGTMDTCNGDPWEGQIEEDGEGGFVAHWTFCVEGTGTGLSGVPFLIECPITDTEIHCDATIVPSAETPPTPTMPSIETMGEFTLHESLGLMHADGEAGNPDPPDPPDVHVENTGAHALSSEVDLAVTSHIGGGVEVPGIQCQNAWELTAGEDGTFEIDASDISSHSGSAGLCDAMHPCNDEPWAGEIVEDGVGGFEAEFDFCLDETSAGIDGNTYELTCPITDSELHCDQMIVDGAGTVPSPRIEVSGEAAISGDLGLMHGSTVHVENDGERALSSEVDLGVLSHIGGGIEVPSIQCDNVWELTVAENGALEIDASGISSHTGSTGLCDTLHPCDNDPWTGAVVEDGDGGFVAEFGICIAESGSGLDGTTYPLACPIANGELHCDQRIITGAGTIQSPHVEVQGEATVGSSLGLMHTD
jgi:hypothetical protein